MVELLNRLCAVQGLSYSSHGKGGELPGRQEQMLGDGKRDQTQPHPSHQSDLAGQKLLSKEMPMNSSGLLKADDVI